MKVVLCYGDSNTWGSDPAGNGRFAPDVRWTGVLARELGDGYRVIEEGLGGRTTNIDDPIEQYRDGRAQLRPCLESHQPFDLIVIMLGTNDLKARHNRSASDIAQSAVALGDIARLSGCGIAGAAPKVLIVAPPATAKLSTYDGMFAGADVKSREFSRRYADFSAKRGFPFLDAGSVIRSSDLDGIHFEAPEHEKLGRRMADEVRRIIG